MYRRLINTVLLLGFTMLGANIALAQEGDSKPIDEVIARVNAGVIMRSAFESYQREWLEELKRQGVKGDELEKKFNELKPTILDDLISNQLILQRAKDLSINVEAQVNQQILRIMKDVNCDSDKCLEQKVREAGSDIEEIKRTLVEKFSRESVLNQEVYGKIFRGLTEKEKREFYDKNKQQYSEPGEVTLSNISVSFGKDPDQALAHAKEIVAQARSGAADFKDLIEKYSEGDKKASVGTAFKIPDLRPEVKEAVEKAKVGEITDPIKNDSGYSIYHIDQRKEESRLPFEDERVQNHIGQSLVEQHQTEEIDQYLDKLRNEAFIEIDPRYQFDKLKTKSAQIKRVPYADEADKKKKDKDKDKDKEAKDKEAKSKKDNSGDKDKDKNKDKKPEEAPKASADNKP